MLFLCVLVELSCVLTWLLVSLQPALTVSICSLYDGSNGTPVGKYRTCSIYLPDNVGYVPYTHWGSPKCDRDGSSYESTCPGFVGMNLTFQCSFEGGQLYIDGVNLNASSVNYGLLLAHHAGLYECRNSSNHLIGAQNLTVNEDVRISGPDSRCRRFFYDSEQTCCKATSDWPLTREDTTMQLIVLANPDNVTVAVEQIGWLIDQETRSAVDIGLYATRDDNDPVLWTIGVRNFAYKITDNTPSVAFRFTASSGTSNHSVCLTANFEGQESVAVENANLPTNRSVMVGQEVTFQCQFSYSGEAEIYNMVILDWVKPINTGNETITEMCFAELFFTTQYNYSNCSSVQIKATKEKEKSNHLSHVVTYTLRVPRVSASLNGSIFTCSLYINHYLQWSKSATLSVTPASVTPASVTPPIAKHVAIVSSVIAVLTVVIVVVIVAVGTTIVIRKNRSSHEIDPDEEFDDEMTFVDVGHKGSSQWQNLKLIKIGQLS